MKYQLKDCVTYLKDNAEHVTYGILMLGLLLVFWSPVAIYQVDAFSGPMLYVWRGVTALFLWIIFYCLCTVCKNASSGYS